MQRWPFPVLFCLSIGTLIGQTSPSPAVQPFFIKHCVGCHNEKISTANLNLTVPQKPEVWDKVLDKLTSGKMPPAGRPAPSKAELTPVTEWATDLLNRAGLNRQNEAGRVTARRLNRVEYNNTIRDLLGVTARPAGDFPVDDSGYGFDNNGDVLSVSPLLMEKYMASARSISQLAVFGEPVPPQATRLARLLNRRSPDSEDVLATGNAGTYLPYSLRGAMYGNWTFPVDAEYEFRLRIANFRSGKVLPPRTLVFTVDGKPVITAVVEGSGTVDYSRGEYIARVPVKAGEHRLRASWPELANLKDPRENINPDMRRGLFVDYLEIVGPYAPSMQPPESYRRVFICGHSPGKHTAQCPRTVLRNLMERAYRRPVTEDELGSKLSLVALARKEGDSFEEGVRLALQAILASPNFLFRVEADGTPLTPHPVSEYELASRLSYFLWASMPDENLLRAAREHTLRQPGVLEAQVRRMLSDGRADNLVDNWAAQWLQLRNLGRTKPDSKRFPTVDDELLDAMRRETSLFTSEIIRQDRSILDFIDAPFTYLNGPLARHYGIAGIDGEEFQRVDLDGAQRSGILTQGAILTVSSYPTRTSPPVRGKWVLENLLGTPPPPPPPDVPSLNEANIGKEVSLRQRLEQHRKDASCAPCHNVMDPIGFGLETYDAVGAWRTRDGNFPIETAGVLPGGKSFSGAQELKQILKGQSETFVHNLSEKLLTFSLGRGLERYDKAAVDTIARNVAAHDYKFSALVMEVVNSKPFQMRTPDGVKP